MKKIILSLIMVLSCTISSFAQSHSDRLSLGVGALYERGLDATIAWEHETRHHNAWEYFINGYIKWDECASCGHICPDSFWNNYRTWGIGVTYKPCLVRGRNHYGNLRIGASGGSDTDKFIAGIHAGNSLPVFMPVTSIIYHSVMAGDCIFRPNATLSSLTVRICSELV